MTDHMQGTPGAVQFGLSLALIGLLAGCNYSGAPDGAKSTTTGKGQAGYTQQAASDYAAAPAGATYTVVPGDTVHGVAQRLHISTQQLVEVNNLKPPYRLTPGQQLVAAPGG